MKTVYNILAFLCILLAIAFGLYVGFWLCLVGGIVGVVTAVKATPILTGLLAWSIARILLTGVAGWAAFFFGTFVAALLASAGSSISVKLKHRPMKSLDEIKGGPFGRFDTKAWDPFKDKQ